MNKKQLLKIHRYIFLLFIFLFECKSKEETSAFDNIENYFKKKEWSFPIAILDSAITTKYYPDTSSIFFVPERYSIDVNKITRLYENTQYIKTLLKDAISDTSKYKEYGYTVSKPTILIDTSVYGTNIETRVFLGFNVLVYKINRDSTSAGVPCEDCVLEENKQILKYPHGILFELNKTKDSLVFSNWD